MLHLSDSARSEYEVMTDLLQITRRLKVLHVAIAVIGPLFLVVLFVARDPQVALPEEFYITYTFASTVIGSVMVWLAFKLYPFWGAALALLLWQIPVVNIFVLLSVRNKAAKILKDQAAQAEATGGLVEIQPRFVWDRRITTAVIVLLLGFVAYSAIMSAQIVM